MTFDTKNVGEIDEMFDAVIKTFQEAHSAYDDAMLYLDSGQNTSKSAVTELAGALDRFQHKLRVFREEMDV